MSSSDGRVADPLGDALRDYQPRTDAEAADLARLRARLAAGDPWRRGSALHVTASAVIVHPPTGRVLLRWHQRQGTWLQVGGHADPGETDPLAIALREASEETGLSDLAPWPDASLAHLVIVAVPASADEPAHEHADLRYLLATADPAAARPERPGAAVRWESLDQARALTASPSLRETLARLEPHLRLPGDRGLSRSR